MGPQWQDLSGYKWKNMNQKQTEETIKKKNQFIFTWNCDAALDLVKKKLPDSLFQ